MKQRFSKIFYDATFGNEGFQRFTEGWYLRVKQCIVNDGSPTSRTEYPKKITFHPVPPLKDMSQELGVLLHPHNSKRVIPFHRQH